MLPMQSISVTLTVITTGYDDPTFFYIDDNLYTDVPVDDRSCIPEVLYKIMNSHIIAKVVELRFSDEAKDRLSDEYDVIIGLEKLSDYLESDFE